MRVVLREVRTGRKCRIYALGTRDTCALFDFLDGLRQDDVDALARTDALLDRTADHGPPVYDDTKCRFFRDLRAFELKTRDGVRIMAFWDEQRLIVCSHGFLKKSRRTPPADLERLRRAKIEYLAAKQDGRLEFVDPAGECAQ